MSSGFVKSLKKCIIIIFIFLMIRRDEMDHVLVFFSSYCDFVRVRNTQVMLICTIGSGPCEVDIAGKPP